MKKVLIITYYWPPSGGAGVQRWLKFIKYLREFGWEPIVFTAEGGEVPVIDKSLEKDIPKEIEVIKEPIWEPYTAYKRLIGQKKEEKIQTGFLSENKKPKLMERVSVWVRGNFFIPDARKFWIKPSVKTLSVYLEKNKIDAIVSNGPPHTTHMIGLALKKRFGIPWLADFRDPWTNIDFYDKLMLSKWADKKHHRLEAEVIEKADSLVTVSPNWAADFEKQNNRKFNVIFNGFDAADFEAKEVVIDKKFTIVHIGSMNKDRNPTNLWKVLGKISEEVEGFLDDLEIKMVGPTDVAIKDALKKNGLQNNLNKIDYVPHEEVVTYLLAAQILLLPINDTPNSMGVIPGKLFEYLAAKRPIICIGPLKGDSCQIINSTNAGFTFSFTEEVELKKCILKMYSGYKDSGSVQAANRNGVDQFSRKNLTRQMSELLNEIV